MDTPHIHAVTIPAQGVESLAWRGDSLVDWVGGGAVHELDGTHHRACVRYAYRFDAVTTCPDGRLAVIYERQGTKGLVLRDGKILREINRSFYQAEAYDFPVCVWNAASGTTLLAHCPHEYNELVIEEAETGRTLAALPQDSDRQAQDFFHSGLQASPGGKRLLSAGWIWHPWEAVAFYDVHRALEDPLHLASAQGCDPDCPHVGMLTETSATWQSDDRIILAGGQEDGSEDELAAQVQSGLRRHGIGVYDVPSSRMVSSITTDRPPGRLMAVGDEFVVAFYQSPRLVRLRDGHVVHEWTHWPTGEQQSCITLGLDRLPPIALDPRGGRFAVATADAIHVAMIKAPQ